MFTSTPKRSLIGPLSRRAPTRPTQPVEPAAPTANDSRNAGAGAASVCASLTELWRSAAARAARIRCRTTTSDSEGASGESIGSRQVSAVDPLEARRGDDDDAARRSVSGAS